jgi:hypothetical protein
LFVGGGSSPLFQALLTGANICEGSIFPPPTTSVLAAPLHPVLTQNSQSCGFKPTIKKNKNFKNKIYKRKLND